MKNESLNLGIWRESWRESNWGLTSRRRRRRRVILEYNFRLQIVIYNLHCNSKALKAFHRSVTGERTRDSNSHLIMKFQFAQVL